MTDPLVLVKRIASEVVLLVVSNRLKEHASEPDDPANIITCAELSVFRLGVENKGRKESQQHPHTWGGGGGVLVSAQVPSYMSMVANLDASLTLISLFLGDNTWEGRAVEKGGGGGGGGGQCIPFRILKN